MLISESYLPHAKALMVNCRRQGNWKGDFCILTTEDCELYLEGRGINVMRAPVKAYSNQVKFWIFSDYFRRWKRLLYLDCDCLVQGDLNDGFDGMEGKLPGIACDGGQDASNGTVMHNWKHFDTADGPGPDTHLELYEKMEARFPHANSITFTTDVCFFAPQSNPPGILEKLQAVAEEFKEANIKRHDQPVFALALYDSMVPLTKDYCCWFPFDEPKNRVEDKSRCWRGDETPLILHYWSWYAPWIVKEDLDPPMRCYYNHRLDRVCHELYAENLAAFDEEFPCYE